MSCCTENRCKGSLIANRPNLGSKAGDIAVIINAGGMKPLKLQIIKAVYGVDGITKDVTVAIQKNAGALPWIKLSGGIQ